ncbi:hypothetical protein OSB04_011385 [Centaurea solstitialis]|uniref:BED-type domain-containing protein n=1 Tax=Centaurea solstitialis TaxID=347529 RepID=A0AA38TMG2_9ASTR|nr:hypothetical protein OSB04_011385 [Centaurea solstitialis]
MDIRVNSSMEETQGEEDCIDDTPTVDIDDASDKDEEGNVAKISKRKRATKKRSLYWNHFEDNVVEENDGVKRMYAKCKYCSTNLRADSNRNGTSCLRKHFPRCKENSENKKKQNILQFKKESYGEGSVGTWKHDDVRIKKATLNLFVVGELPFKFVENEAFVEYTNALNGRVTLPSRHTVSRDVGNVRIMCETVTEITVSNVIRH